ncbi:uncharacterized protein LOC144912949 [Branchiostoma floridae x Branchiostoma belcheri]
MADTTVPATADGLDGTVDLNKCTRNPCLHGRCVNNAGGYNCACNPGWTGQNCRQDMNECDGNPCEHGRCVNKDGGYKCNCNPGWTGRNCQQADAVGLWPLNSQYGASDKTGNGNDGVARGTQLAPGPNGDPDGAFLFSGTANSYIDIPNNGKLDVRYSYTILAHIYPTGQAGPIFDYVGQWGWNRWAVPRWSVHFWQTTPQNLFMRYMTSVGEEKGD